ncbi:serine hydrolase [Asticcacaulis sp. AC466]|uniref:serine hydrolase n=1 Tax=Asticcacaulis sp. AC466 TaxID=1282362 RepID=UPI00041D241A|nr:serine hydrolase [Asticcacaulis sp. AC466]
MKMLLPIMAVLGVFWVGNAIADERAAKIDAFFAAQAQGDAFNGNVLAAENGKIVYQKSFGFADFEAERRNTADTEFEMASIGKVFTATAVLQLVDRGKIGLDIPLVRYFPAFPYKDITIRQLLSHTSGLLEGDFEAPFAAYQAKTGRQMTMDDLVPAIAAANINHRLKPGEKWWYCNLCYELLAHLVEVRTGQRFDAYLISHVLTPAGMAHTYLKTAQLNHADTPQFAQNYDFPFRYSSQRVRFDGARSYYQDLTYGNASVVSTTGDMLKFDLALSDGRLLSAKTLATAYAPARLADGSPNFVWKNIGGMGDADDGLGWFIFRDKSLGTIVWHAGGMPGCATMFMRNLTRHQTVIVFDNTDSEGLYKKALSAMRLLNDLPPLPIQKSLAKIYGRALMDHGSDAAFGQLYSLKGDRSYALSEDDLNNLGYEFAEHGHLSQANDTLRTAIGLYPDSDNLPESYAEILEKAGQTGLAAQMYRYALTLNPGNTDAKEGLKRTMK